MTDETQEKKIIIDEDWKEQAQREKEMLAEALEKEAEEKRIRRQMPASFPVLVSSLATQAVMALGEIENPVTKKKEKNLDESKFNIDLLEMLQEKTKGNLSPEEEKMMEDLLFDLRMRFVNVSKAK